MTEPTGPTAPKMAAPPGYVVLLTILRLLLGSLFLYTGGIKAFDTQSFAYAVQNYQLTSWTVSILIAVYLPWLEITVGIALMAKRFYQGALACAATLSLIFLAAISSAWWRQLDISCGCFGSETNHTSYPLHLFADALIMATSLWLAFHDRATRSPRGL